VNTKARGQCLLQLLLLLLGLVLSLVLLLWVPGALLADLSGLLHVQLRS
jgi:hypothetical protein